MLSLPYRHQSIPIFMPEADWSLHDPVLQEGQMAYSEDIDRFKIGRAGKRWSETAYVAAGSPGGGSSAFSLFAGLGV